MHYSDMHECLLNPSISSLPAERDAGPGKEKPYFRSGNMPRERKHHSGVISRGILGGAILLI